MKFDVSRLTPHALSRFFADFVSKRRAQSSAPTVLWLLLLLGLCATTALSLLRGSPRSEQQALGLPPSTQVARLYALDDGVTFAKVLNLVVQSHDTQPGLSLRYGQLNYEELVQWLDLSLALNPTGQYPLMAGARIYTQPSADEARQRKIAQWVADRFKDDPIRRWQWMAHIAYVAKAQFKDIPLALEYAQQLREQTEQMPSVPAWARQLEIFFRLNLNEADTAKYMIANLLASGQIKDDNEWRFLKHTLDEIETGKRGRE